MICYFNGDFLPKEQVHISPDDRAFYFGDGVYEVVKYYTGKAFRMADHIARLKRSLKEIRIDWPNAEVENLVSVCDELVQKNENLGESPGVYLQISRGEHPRKHKFPDVKIEPTVYTYAFPKPRLTTQVEEGVKVITREDIRWKRCDIKSLLLLPNSMLFQEAVEVGARECFMIKDGYITEATHNSVLGVKNGKVYTHPLNYDVLPGITRKVVQEICAAQNVPFIEESIAMDDLSNFDEMMIAGTGSEVTPVTQVDDVIIGNGKPGEITRIIQQAFFKLCEGK